MQLPHKRFENWLDLASDESVSEEDIVEWVNGLWVMQARIDELEERRVGRSIGARSIRAELEPVEMRRRDALARRLAKFRGGCE